MTLDEYVAYVRDAQCRLSEACLQARCGLAADPGEEQEAREDLEALYEDEDPFTTWDEPLVFLPASELVPGEKGVSDGPPVRP